MIREINISEMQQSLEYITLAHMDVPIDIRRVLIDRYQGAERDLCVFIVQGFYKKYLDKVGGKMSTGNKKVALSYSKYQTITLLTTELKDLIDRGAAYMFVEAAETGWFHDLEYDNLTELLASVYEGKEGKDEAYDWKFIIETLIPAARKADIPADLLVGASVQIKKLRGMVPAARELLERQQNNAIAPEVAEETLLGWIKEVANPQVGYVEFHETIDEWRGKSVGRNDPIIGYKIMTPDGKFWLVLPTESDRDIAILEQALKNRASVNLTGLDWLFNKVMGMMKINRKGDTHGAESSKVV